MTNRLLGAADVPALERFLRPRIETSLFLLGNLGLAGIDYDGRMYSGTYAGSFRDGALTGVVAHYWNGNMMLQAPEPGDAAALARDALRMSARGLRGLIGPNDQVIAARDDLGVPPALLQLDSEDRLYRLDFGALSVPAALGSGSVRGRRAEMRDLDILAPWRIDYEIHLVHAEDTPAMRVDARAAVERAIAERRFWVLEEDGRIVAMTGFNTQYEDLVQVGGVYTPPELRRRGYGRSVVAASLIDARNEGRKRSILFTGLHNVAAQHSYEALGYQPIGNYRLTLLRDPCKATCDRNTR